MGKIRFTLEDTLNTLDVSRNKLAVEAKVRPATIADIVKSESKSINYDTLTAILDTINRLASEKKIDKRFNVTDVFTYDAE
ncbi:hypothetical protein AB1K91_02645 [Terribacillus sp. 179-K 1B1 HS]|uniref:hypothetical protein n=1 Tax=Terribacillus sp. 179-K 1B1 HS TaxID=3142388 RepID=UPI00399F9BC0